ncbi:right-handed parallel beta-helix repeat-containing protein [Microbulbifer sp. SSSA002]|uniref:right-handed parallel beta-helix repeat-containing protein n=1 Tax=unclassified Microbulbifer TaxID=2619833 RepID=UPI00403A619A
MKNGNMNPLKILLITAAGTTGLSLAAAASAVSCGDVITTAETLTGDILHCDIHPALLIKDNGSLDLNGHTVSCDGDSTGIRLSGFNRVLHDSTGLGSVENCNNGVSAEGEGGHQIVDINTTGNFISGITLSSSNNSLKTSIANANLGIGIRVIGDGNHVRSSEATGNSLQGIKVTGASNYIRLNTASNNTQSGIAISGGTGSLISENLAEDNHTHGIILLGDGEVGNMVADNVASNNTYTDLSDRSTLPCFENIWSNNDYTTSNETCIE